jgi:hypothetical protein
MNKALTGLLLIGGWCAPADAAELSKADASGPAAVSMQAERGVEDPRAFVARVYDAYLAEPTEPIDWPAYAYSDRLRALFDAYDAWAAGHEDLVGSLDFDWWVNAQDWSLSDVRVREVQAGADRRIVMARFSNAGRPDEIRFHFVRQGARWYLDDAVQGIGSGDGGWTLSELLSERPE